MNPGILKRKIIIQESQQTETVTGFTTIWIDKAIVRASVQPLYGKELYQAQAVNAEYTVKFIIRYRKGLDTSMRILYDGKIYAIDNIIDPMDAHKELVLLCKVIENEQ